MTSIYEFKHAKRIVEITLSACAMAVLVACGGGGGSAATTTSISGTAAVGLPLVGTVTVRDRNGLTRTDTVSLADNGSYSIDVTGLVAPFVFRASGEVGGRQYVVHSAATEADVGGTINITQLTDLIVSNVAGELANDYFDRGSFSGLTAAQLNAERDQLRARLLPVLQALGADVNDLIRTPFTPLASALDKALDILRVDYAAGAAEITNVVTGQQIQDSLATKAAQEPSPATLSNTAGVASAGTDIDAVRAALRNFAQRFATGLPSAGSLRGLLSVDFLHSDQTANEFLDELTAAGSAVGVTFDEISVKSIDYSNPQRPVAKVSFVMKTQAGGFFSNVRDWQLVKSNGAWLLHGDQRELDIEAVAMMTSTQQSGRSGSCLKSGLSLRIEDYNSENNRGTISHVIVTGPGLPNAGVRMIEPSLGNKFVIEASVEASPRNGDSFTFYTTANSCSDFELAGLASLPSNATYTFSARNSQNQALFSHTDVVFKRPMALSEMRATTKFPAITAPTLNAWSSFAGGTLNVTATGFDPGSLSDVVAIVLSDGEPGLQEVIKDMVVPSNGIISTSLFLNTPSSAITYRELQAENFTPDGREFVTRLLNLGN